MKRESLFEKARSFFVPKKEVPVQPVIRRLQETSRQNPSSLNYPWPNLSPEAFNCLKAGGASKYESHRQVIIINEPHESREGQYDLYKFLGILYQDNPHLVRRSVFLSEGYPADERLSLQPLIEAEPNPSDELIRDVLNSYLITGYMAYEWKDQKGIPIVGTDDRDIYDLRLNREDHAWANGELKIMNGHICAKDYYTEDWDPVLVYATEMTEIQQFVELEKKLINAKRIVSKGTKSWHLAITKDNIPHVLVSNEDIEMSLNVARNASIARTLIDKAKDPYMFPILFVGSGHLDGSMKENTLFNAVKMAFAAQRAMRMDVLSMYSSSATPFARISSERFLDFENKSIADYLEAEKIGFVSLSSAKFDESYGGGINSERYQRLFKVQLSGDYQKYVEELASELKARRDLTTIRPNPEAAALFVKALKAIKGEVKPPFVGIGNPKGDAKFYKEQHGGTCAVVAQEGIIHELIGKDPGEETLKQKAIEKGWYKEGEGTEPQNLDKLLDEEYKIPVERFWHCTIDDLKREIEQGNKVIVGVDPHILWYNIGSRGKAHVVRVTGLRTDPKDGRIISVAMNDSGNKKIDGGGEVPVDRFMRAWKQMRSIMIATRLPKKL